jgi:hypothetical protein
MYVNLRPAQCLSFESRFQFRKFDYQEIFKCCKPYGFTVCLKEYAIHRAIIEGSEQLFNS